MKCYKQCQAKNKSCKEQDCRLWIDYTNDLNCSMIAINKHPDGNMTLREVADRLHISFVRVKQIEEKALSKLGITGRGLKKFLEKNEST
jgi:YesN/AraC family two-component response regulator